MKRATDEAASSLTEAGRKAAIAEELIDSGWEALGQRGSTPRKVAEAAAKHFRKALALNPDAADAFVGLGIICERRGFYAEAEAMYRTAVVKARIQLGNDRVKSRVWWAELETRPYMRARHNLGLILWRQGKLEDALHEFQEVLRRNPRDNTGVRYLLGGLFHLSGRLDAAITHYERAGGAGLVGFYDPHNEFNYALALFQKRQYDAAILRYRAAFFLNMYLPLVVLSIAPKPLNIWHASNTAEPEYALDYWEQYSALWNTDSNARRFLGSVYHDEAVQADLEQSVELGADMLREKEPSGRHLLLEEQQKLQHFKRLESTNSEIASRVLARYRAVH